MRLRRVLLISAVMLLASWVTLGGMAFADNTFSADDVTLSDITVTPASLSGDGQVEVAMTVSVAENRANGGISEVKVTGYEVISSDVIESISAGGNATLRFTLNVSASQLGSPIPLTAYWAEYTAGLPFDVTVASNASAEPQVEFARTLDKVTANKGDSVAIVYEVQNTGSVEITNLVVTDSGVEADMGLKKNKLSPGDSATFTYNHTINSDFTSSPKLTYQAGEMTYTKTIPSKTVTLQLAQIDAVLEASPDTVEPGGEITLLCTLTNSGNTKLTGITLSEASLGSKLFASTTLDAGASKQFSKKVTLTKSATFQYTITAKDEAGQTYTFKSNALKVNVSAGAAQYDIGIQASPDAIQLSAPGSIRFKITVTNKGADAVSNASIVDQDGNSVRKIDSLPPGATEYSWDTTIDKTTVFNFCLVVPGNEGNYEVYTGPIEITVVNATASPARTNEASPTPLPSGSAIPAESTAANGASAGRVGALLTAMAVVGVLIVVTICALIALLVADRRKRKAAAKR